MSIAIGVGGGREVDADGVVHNKTEIAASGNMREIGGNAGA